MVEGMGVVVRNGKPRSQNRHIVRKAAADANDGIPEPIEGRQTERVDSRELLAKLEQEINGPRARSPSDLEAMLEVTVVAPSSSVPKAAAPARLAHTMRRPDAVPPARPIPQPIVAKGSAPLLPRTVVMPMPVDDDVDVPVSFADGSGPLEPMSGPVPSPVHDQTTEPAPAFEATFDASKLAGPLARHGERVASIEMTPPRLRPRDVVLGILLGLGIVGGAWLTLMALL